MSQFDRIERKVNWAIAVAVIALVLGLVNIARGVTSEEIAQARAYQNTLPPEVRPYSYYVSTSCYPEAIRPQAEVALKFVVAMSSSQPIAERCVPLRVNETLWRLDFTQLRWDANQWYHVVKEYPYAVGGTRNPVDARSYLPLVVDAGWLVVVLSDTTESDAHYRLLYGNADITRDEFLAFWGVNRKARSSFGIITRSESPIGPSVAGIRQIDNYPTNERGSAWGTRDSAKIDADTDPLEHLDGSGKHDAEEWLVAHPKRSVSGGYGFLLAALLANGKGDRQEEAPPSIVTDKLGFRGQHAIRNWGSCVACHATGINPPSNNLVRDTLKAGVEIYAKKGVYEQIEQFYLSDAAKQIERDNEDYEAGVQMICGVTGEECASAFRASINHYDAPVTLAQACVELGIEEGELKIRIGLAQEKGYHLGARTAALVAGEAMPRTSWESYGYGQIIQALELAQ